MHRRCRPRRALRQLSYSATRVRSVRSRLALLAALLCTAGAARLAHASVPTVAVMPFKDLSGQKGAVGEALRETVTADLREARGVTVIERGAIDKVLGEQALQAMRADLDPLSTVKVGKLLGASLLVTGAYQRDATSIRLTARFVKVETGEIVGSAKVDGPAGDFLRLQDRVTAELLRSAGLDAGQVRRIAQRARPKLKGLRAVELYGDAISEPDDQKRSQLLRLAVDEDPAFGYALKDLEALEKRMKAYARTADAAQDEAQRKLRAQIAAEADPQKRAQLQLQAFGAQLAQRRYRQLRADARALLAGPPLPPAPNGPRIDELAAYYVLTADQALHDRDALLRDGEAFLARFPASVYFKAAESLVRNAIDQRRDEEARKAKLPDELAELRTEQRWDLCNLARIHARAAMHLEAQRLFRACVAVGASDRAQAARGLVQADIDAADWAAARRDLQLLDGAKDEHAGSYRQSLEQQIPTDG